MAKLSDKRKEALDKLMHIDICEAAVSLLKESGFDFLTMSKVAEKAEVSKGTLYNYFKDKEELIDSTEEYVFNPFFLSIFTKVESDLPTLQKLRDIAELMLNHFDKYGHMIMLFLRDNDRAILKSKAKLKKREELINKIKLVIQEGVESGLFKNISSKTATEIFLGSVMSINLSKLLTGMTRSIPDDIENIMLIYLNGIVNN